MLTLKQFNQIEPGKTLAFGTLPNSPEGLFMTSTGGELKWVAKKGWANDWTIYCHWSDKSLEWIEQHGDKVHTEIHIRRCVPCEDAVLNTYRF